jgi:hypothetical protein
LQKVLPMQAALLGPGSDAGLSATLQPEVAALKKRLLAIDGWAVAINPIEDGDRIWDHEPIYERGQSWSGEDAILDCRAWPRLPELPSTGNAAHANCIGLKLATPDTATTQLRVCTGYALSEDGVWRHHSWLAAAVSGEDGVKAERVVETTQLRQHYYGFARDAKGLKRLLRQVRAAQARPVYETRARNRNQFSSGEGPKQTDPVRSTHRCASSTTAPRAPRTASRRESAPGSGTAKRNRRRSRRRRRSLPLSLSVARSAPVVAVPPMAA